MIIIPFDRSHSIVFTMWVDKLTNQYSSLNLTSGINSFWSTEQNIIFYILDSRSDLDLDLNSIYFMLHFACNSDFFLNNNLIVACIGYLHDINLMQMYSGCFLCVNCATESFSSTFFYYKFSFNSWVMITSFLYMYP